MKSELWRVFKPVGQELMLAQMSEEQFRNWRNSTEHVSPSKELLNMLLEKGLIERYCEFKNK